MLHGCASDLPITSSTLERECPGTTSSHRAHHSISARRPVGSASAPPSLSSSRDHRPYGSTGLSNPSSSTLASHHSACTTDFLAFSCASSLHPFGSVRLCLPYGSALILSHTGFASVLRSLFGVLVLCPVFARVSCSLDWISRRCFLFPVHRWIVLWFSPTDYTAPLHGHTSPVTTHRISHRPSRSLRHHSPAVVIVSYL
ncbi:hypothetical protein DPX16_22431 [Anabarilius grahami]|uniref:Uncharacterized protein n=1 Tax=Anabarilius grahami TaxID=495550 RepID=A0A3N0YYF9_ANAGA|nr:hypothetical protein DPX16_22431 [Anabarilius grahami]